MLPRLKFIFTFLLFLPANFLVAANSPKPDIDVVRVFDSRLPGLTRQDMREIFNETNKTLKTKLGTECRFNFHDLGSVEIQNFFESFEYRTPQFEKRLATEQYPLNGLPPFEGEKNSIIRFLKQWKISDLARFFPNDKVKTYDDIFNELVPIYVYKVERLKKINLPDGSRLLYLNGVPYQSYLHWQALMHEQDRFDIVITNSLIVYDKFKQPYPHAVLKHAKVGGGSFESPKRQALDGHSVLVNILEDSGAIEEFSGDLKGLSQKQRNKILASFLFAHEIGHAFYYIPDVYDHGDACLMNSSFENLGHRKGYELLVQDGTACRSCRPYVKAKEAALAGQNAMAREDYQTAGQSFERAADNTPYWVDTDLGSYLLKLYAHAKEAYKKAGDSKAIERIMTKMKPYKDALAGSHFPDTTTP